MSVRFVALGAAFGAMAASKSSSSTMTAVSRPVILISSTDCQLLLNVNNPPRHSAAPFFAYVTEPSASEMLVSNVSDAPTTAAPSRYPVIVSKELVPSPEPVSISIETRRNSAPSAAVIRASRGPERTSVNSP